MELRQDRQLIRCCVFFFFQAESGIRDLVRSRGLGDVYRRQLQSGQQPGEVADETAGLAARQFGDDARIDRRLCIEKALELERIRHGAARADGYRMTRTGMAVCTSTSAVWLPSSAFLSPRRPCDAMTMRSQAFISANLTIATAGFSSISCTISKTNVTCNGAQNGTASVNVTQGTAPFTYLWSNGKTTSGISGLGVGTFTVTVSNINGCSSSCQVIITQPVKVGCNITVAANALCGACTGSLVADQQNTVGTVTFLWSNGATTANIYDLLPGIYSITVTDANADEATGSWEVVLSLIHI